MMYELCCAECGDLIGYSDNDIVTVLCEHCYTNFYNGGGEE